MNIEKPSNVKIFTNSECAECAQRTTEFCSLLQNRGIAYTLYDLNETAGEGFFSTVDLLLDAIFRVGKYPASLPIIDFGEQNVFSETTSIQQHIT